MATKLAPSTALPEQERTDLYAMLTELVKAQATAAEATAKERELREKIAARWFSKAEEGTATMPLEYGKALKVGIGITRSVNKEGLDAFNKTNTSNSLKDELDKVIVYKPSVSVSAWKDASPEAKLAFCDIVIEKPSLPTVEVATPKR